MTLTIEPEQPADVPAIRDVVGRAFHDEPVVTDLVELIRASPQYLPELALVARVDGQIAGFVMISRAVLVDDTEVNRDVLNLSPLAVAPEFERRGIGSALVRASLDRAASTPAALVALEGSPRYYGGLGFRPAVDFGVHIELPDWAPAEAAQVYPLPGYTPEVRGRLVYPPPFDILP